MSDVKTLDEYVAEHLPELRAEIACHIKQYELHPRDAEALERVIMTSIRQYDEDRTYSEEAYLWNIGKSHEKPTKPVRIHELLWAEPQHISPDDAQFLRDVQKTIKRTKKE